MTEHGSNRKRNGSNKSHPFKKDVLGDKVPLWIQNERGGLETKDYGIEVVTEWKC